MAVTIRPWEPGYDFITNWPYPRYDQYRTMNEGGVKFCGVKNTFSNNEVYNITDMALNFAIVGGGPTSLDCVIENNTFHDVVLNGKDMGAVYGGRDARAGRGHPEQPFLQHCQQ